MINVTINRKEEKIDENTTPRKLFDERMIINGAIWVNGRQLLKENHLYYNFSEGDEIKILRIMGGG